MERWTVKNVVVILFCTSMILCDCASCLSLSNENMGWEKKIFQEKKSFTEYFSTPSFNLSIFLTFCRFSDRFNIILGLLLILLCNLLVIFGIFFHKHRFLWPWLAFTFLGISRYLLGVCFETLSNFDFFDVVHYNCHSQTTTTTLTTKQPKP